MGVQTTDFKQAKTIGRYDANDYLHQSVENIFVSFFSLSLSIFLSFVFFSFLLFSLISC